MARDHIEFIQSQFLPWDGAVLDAVRPGAAARVLSRDDATGALSLVVRYPAGYARSAAEHLAVDEEFLVLDGAIEVNGQDCGRLFYGHLPAGLPRTGFAAPGGAVVLTFFSAAPASRPGAPEGGADAAFDPRRLVAPLDALTVPYTGNFHPEFPPGAGRKMLYQDPQTGEQSWLLGTMPLRWAERSERHPVIEEMYLLAGEVHGDRGVMRPGAYFWRPPGVPHGPYGTLTGNLYFFRTKGGPLSTEYQDAAVPFHWSPAHRPILPVALRPYGDAAPAAGRCW